MARIPHSQRKTALAVSFVLQILPLAAVAQQASEPAPSAESPAAIETIVVTAQRRTQNQQDVGVAMTALNASKLDDLHIVSTTDIQQFTPSVTFATTAGEGHKTNVVIRGVGLNSSSNLREANVGMYVDDVYISNTSGLTSSLFDMERVEVLRGPQGTLYGNTVTGGLVHYITRKPSRAFESFVAFEVGSYNSRRAEAAVGGALGENVSGRFSALIDKNDGYIRNSLGRNHNDKDDQAFRGQLLFEPGKGTSILVKAYASDNTPDSGPGWKPRVAFLNPATGLGEAVPAGPCPAGCDSPGNPASISQGSIWSVANSGPSALRVKRSGIGVKADIDLGFATLTSVTDQSKVFKHYEEDSSGAPLQSTYFETNVDAKQFQQEFRLAGITSGGIAWNSGLYYLTRDDVDYGGADFTPAVGKGFFPAFLNYKDVSEKFLKSRNISIYGQVEAPLTQDLSLVAGVRAYKQTEDTTNITKLQRVATGVVDVSAPIIATFKSDDPSGKVGLNWKLDKRTLIFASISRGARPGYAQNSTNVLAPTIVQPELLTSYEAGFKTDFTSVPVRLNASAYHYDYKNMQTNAFLGLASFQLNKDATVNGGEMEIIFKPSSNLELSANLGVLDGKVKNVQYRTADAATNPRYRDTELPNAPKTTFSAQAKYDWQVADGKAFAFLSQSYRSASYAEIENNPVQRVEGYSLTNVRVGYAPKSDKWQAGVYVNNLMNKEYFNFIGFVSSIRIAQQFPGKPRWVGAYYNYSFN